MFDANAQVFWCHASESVSTKRSHALLSCVILYSGSVGKIQVWQNQNSKKLYFCGVVLRFCTVKKPWLLSYWLPRLNWLLPWENTSKSYTAGVCLEIEPTAQIEKCENSLRYDFFSEQMGMKSSLVISEKCCAEIFNILNVRVLLTLHIWARNDLICYIFIWVSEDLSIFIKL